MYCYKRYIPFIVKIFCLKLQWCAKFQISIILKKDTSFAEFCPIIKIYVILQKIFWQVMKLSPFSKSSLITTELFNLIFFKTCSEGVDFPRIDTIALFCLIPIHCMSNNNFILTTVNLYLNIFLLLDRIQTF